MIASIMQSISCSIHAEFGDTCKIYAEEVKQGLKEPCFFISCISPTNRLFFNRRYLREHPFCIQYFPADESRAKEECYEVLERLYSCLEWIKNQSGDTMMGTKMRSEFIDGILNFFVSYDLFVCKQDKELPKIEELSHHTTAKGAVSKWQ